MSIFSRIIAGEIPCNKIYEDDLCIVILDVNPVSKGHSLVIPKQEIIRLQDLPTELLNHCLSVCQKIMKSMITNIPCSFVQLRVMGEEVPHCHIHLIPMTLSPGKDQSKRPKVEYGDGEMMDILQRIQQGIHHD